jgi:hypothetical protein
MEAYPYINFQSSPRTKISGLEKKDSEKAEIELATD